MAKNYNSERTGILRLLCCSSIDFKEADELLAALEHAEEMKN